MCIGWRIFDKWLKGEVGKEASDKPVRIFVMGINEWRDEDEWPLRRSVDTRFFLHSRGGANTLSGNGALSQNSPDDEPLDSFFNISPTSNPNSEA